MSDLDRLAETVREWQESGLVPGKEADAVLNVAPELIAVARAAQETGPCPHPKGLECRRCYATTEALEALDAKLREVFGDE